LTNKPVCGANQNDKMKCPVCNGTGELTEPKTKKELATLRKDAARILHDAGFGLREIQRLLGLKSPHSVSLYLKTDGCEGK